VNVLAFVTVILPTEIVDGPRHASLCFHPSLLPRFRGGNALAWQILLGATESGVTVFRPDAGVDTGTIVVQKGGVLDLPTDTAASLYFDKLYPLGSTRSPRRSRRSTRGLRCCARRAKRRRATRDRRRRGARLDFAKSAAELDRWIRGCDPQRGAVGAARARWCAASTEVSRAQRGPAAGEVFGSTAVPTFRHGARRARRIGACASATARAAQPRLRVGDR